MKGKVKNIAKDKKIEKDSKTEPEKEVKEGEEEEPKEGGTLSDGVLDAFEETAPVDPLLAVEDESLLDETEEDEEDLDYNPAEW